MFRGVGVVLSCQLFALDQTLIISMASWETHKCDSCEYSFVGSGKPDALMMGQSKKYPQCEDGVIKEDNEWCITLAD